MRGISDKNQLVSGMLSTESGQQVGGRQSVPGSKHDSVFSGTAARGLT